MNNIKEPVKYIGDIQIDTSAKYIGDIQTATKKVLPELEDLNINPTIETQQFKSQDYYGYDNVTCEAINLQSKEVNPTIQSQTITADNNYIGLSNVQINAVTSSIDNNIIPENIKKDVSILGVQGSYEGEGSGKYSPSFISFYYYPGTSLAYEIANIDTSNITSMTYMFANCNKVTELDLSSFDTSNVTSMNCMFENFKKVTELDLSSFDTSNVTNMASMFSGAVDLKKLDLSSFDTRNVTTMTSIFRKVAGLKEIKFGPNWKSYGKETYSNITTGTWTNTTTGDSYTGLQALLVAGRILGAIEGTWVKS